ncbi:cell division control protein 48, AAA family protein [Nitzschia inconspicua]|uniref:Cell division control protein 48, AAA family protein n=1 Tax=Nitzschia inconspicua TaxID=303405 RepID=A0A9K3PZS4_9STRA|nr:cell division control protein 48, AAA family protein [Nitzschia inconspicua]
MSLWSSSVWALPFTTLTVTSSYYNGPFEQTQQQHSGASASAALSMSSSLFTRVLWSNTSPSVSRDASASIHTAMSPLTDTTSTGAAWSGQNTGGSGSNAPSSSSSSSSISSSSSKKKGNTEGGAMKLLVEIVLEVGVILVTTYIASVLIQKLLKNSNFQGLSDEDEQASTQAEKRLHRLLKEQGRSGGSLVLTSYERQIAQDVIDPADIKVEFADIGGMDAMKEEIWQLAVLPLKRPDLFSSSSLLQQPGGILLYGPPGTGKTMLAKAIAKEADATFLAVKLSKIMSKWFGESNKLIDATFGLARKLAPSIIFIDELDTFLNPRDGAENSAGNAIKAEFLTLWDGITTQTKRAGGSSKDGDNNGDDDDDSDEVYAPVMVLGATNRPNHVDNAILRRLPRMFRIELPDEEGRLQILTITLQNSKHPLDDSAKAYLPQLAKSTQGYSGSDLKELLNCAALESVREVMQEESRNAVTIKQQQQPQPTTAGAGGKGKNNNKKKNKKKATAKKKDDTNTSSTNCTSSTTNNTNNHRSKLRPMSAKDLQVAMTKVKRTGQDAAEYERTRFQHDHPNSRQVGNPDDHVNTEQLLRLLMSSLNYNNNHNNHNGGAGGHGGGSGKKNGDDYDDDDNMPEIA